MAVTLFADKRDCCGCGACMNACSRNAITMVTDADGFCYPQIDPALCVDCGACKKVCGYQSVPHKSAPVSCYAVAAKEDAILKRSSSGGFFAVAATEILGKGGVVYGASLSKEDGLVCRHIRVDRMQQLPLLQGSKYVQSDIGITYTQTKEDVLAGKPTLFSGTPCQIAGLVAYLGKEYDNLLTIEVICHGVPGRKMFRDFLTTLEEKKRQKVMDFSFRSKDRGQGMNVCVSYGDTEGNACQVIKNGNLYSYMHYFLKSHIYRSNCYSCPFATKQRVADITIGDYWGFHEEYPTLPAGTQLSNAKGISCVLVNSEKGARCFAECSAYLNVLETQFEKIARHNAQLSRPSVYTEQREEILRLYRENGYGAVEQHYRRTCRKERLVYRVTSLVPKRVKRLLKRVIGLVRVVRE